MSNKQMTAMDFFGHNMAILSFKLETNNITQEGFNVELYNLFQQAKEMERQQIIDAWYDGVRNWDNEKKADQYYTESYGGQNNEQ
jgi:hypothetical protein